jgi:tetratricopeptide (TPR) repeat protein
MVDWRDWLRQAEERFDQKRLDEALELAQRVLRAEPGCGPAHQVLGLVASDRDRPLEAIPLLARAVAMQPDLAPAHNGLGRNYYILGEIEQALHHTNVALSIQPEHAPAHFNRAMIWLKQGRYADGWLEYEWRWPCKIVARPKIPLPRWDGSPLNSRSILVHTEQGLGDVLQFMRFLPELRRRGGRVVLACQKKLHAVLRSIDGVDEWFPIDEPGPITFQVYAPLLSLPALLGVGEPEIRRAGARPYLAADPERIEKWRPQLAALPGFKVGLCWQGNPTFKSDVHRSLPLAHFSPLARMAGVTLVSLQHGAGTEQIQPSRSRVPLHVLDNLDHDAPLVDRAAVISQLDLVITSDTSIAHLAGALGRPVWVLLGKGADWRWLIDRTDSPWYPTARLFRQRTFGGWSGVMIEVAEALRAAAAPGEVALRDAAGNSAQNLPIPTDPVSLAAATPSIAAMPATSDVRAMLMQALELHRAGSLQQAELLYRQVLRLDPAQSEAIKLLGMLANQIGKPEAAINFFRQAIVLRPAEPEYHFHLATAHKSSGDLPAAIDHYRQALRLNPANVIHRANLCDALMEQGDLDEALANNLQALGQDPDNAQAWCTLGELVGHGRHTFTSENIKHMQGLLEHNRLAAGDASILWFTLAAHWERLSDFDEAFRCYRLANERKAEAYRLAKQTFDARKHLELIDGLIDVFTPELFEATRDFGDESELPVFVVGMVRSGTTLVEQILASHRQVFGAGERPDIVQVTDLLPKRIGATTRYPACVKSIDAPTARAVAKDYLLRLTALGGAAIRVVDKMPQNFLHLGLIALLFPRARIIHCRREPMDVCASAYFQNFKWLPHTASLEDIAFYHRQYQRLMAHWQRVLPWPIHEVAYEQMVANQEAISRQLIDFCSLDWDDRCLAFHTNPRAVQTASKLQVRRPIHARSVARWKHFESHLQPLRELLQAP